MKIHRVVQMLGATTDTGKLASDMYDLNYKTYYSEAEGRDIPISHMDFQHMVRAFVKLSAQAQEKPRDYTLEEVRKEKDEALDEGVSLANQVEGLKELLKEKEELLEKEIISKNNWRDAYYQECHTQGDRYAFSEIPNDTDGQEFLDTMKKYLNKTSYKLRVRGQHIKPELKGTGATYWGQSLNESTHMRVYVEKK